MKTLPIIVLIAVISCFAAGVAPSDEHRTFVGEISDSQCALNVHSLTRSHQEMLKSKSMGGSGAECTTYCVKYLGGEYVLSSRTDVYRLDDQDQAAKFAGQTIKLVGVLGPKNTIHVLSIISDTKPKPTEQNPQN